MSKNNHQSHDKICGLEHFPAGEATPRFFLKAEVIRSPGGGARLPRDRNGDFICSDFAPCSQDASIYLLLLLIPPNPLPGVVSVVEATGLKLCLSGKEVQVNK